MLRMFLYSTNHLSDRELYEELWHEVLREEGPVMQLSNDSAWHIDLLGSGSEEDNWLYLRYYADEETRQRWDGRKTCPATTYRHPKRRPTTATGICPPGIRQNGGSTINPPDIASVKATDSAKIASSFSSLNS